MLSQSNEYNELMELYKKAWEEYYDNDYKESLVSIEMIKKTTGKGKKQCDTRVEYNDLDKKCYKLPFRYIGIDKEEYTRIDPDHGQIKYIDECLVFTAPEYEPFPEYESSTPIVSSVMSYESRVYEDGELPFYPIFEMTRDSSEEAFKYTQAAKELNELFEDRT